MGLKSEHIGMIVVDPNNSDIVLLQRTVRFEQRWRPGNL